MKKFLLCFFGFIVFVNVMSAQTKQTWAKEKEKLLESYGMLGSANIYLSYLSLTFLERDIPRNDKTDEISTIIKSVQNLNESIKSDIDKLKKDVALIESDLRFMDSILEIMDNLLKDAELLKVYALTKKEEDRQKFFDNHSLLYDKMNKLFYGDDKPESEGKNEE